MRVTLGNSVTVARQTLTLFVGVQIPIPQPVKDLVKRRGLFLYIFAVLYIFFDPHACNSVDFLS